MDIGKRIRNLRESKKLKVTELAKKSFISQPYLSDIEKGKTQPSIDTLKAICNALEIGIGDFFGKLPELSPTIIQLINDAKKLTDEEVKSLGAFIATFVKERE
ncbi:helix-turn-helix domain-containing protein [Lederbergia sp. NSJ-179]|uniref:helix-turn-helix domain-containing protein n=1 Tax=Lederbergia sp. NSJ-179 TaxID=2931402 RepID=UPI001FD5002F|nr:helix-turn-helix transcriptional regulator [Lederbergia sp. NSJ-179]MCJ7841273.1 helix-turn-helix domain-containing protein [Lederbergia sp. NSJ-179]